MHIVHISFMLSTPISGYFSWGIRHGIAFEGNTNCNANRHIKRCHKWATKFSDQPQMCLTFPLRMNRSYLIPNDRYRCSSVHWLDRITIWKYTHQAWSSARSDESLFFGKRRNLPPLSTLELKSCDVPEGFNDSIPMFFVLKGLIIYFKGKHCRRLFSAQLSILFLSQSVHTFHHGGVGTGSRCSCGNMVRVRSWNRLDGTAHLYQWLHHSALESWLLVGVCIICKYALLPSAST